MKKVYVLTETYKDGDRENIGVYGSLRAMARGFAEHIIEQEKARVLFSAVGAEDRAKDEETFNTDVAHKIADLLIALFDLDGSDECRDGNTVYSWGEEEVQWVGIEEDEEEADDEEEDEE